MSDPYLGEIRVFSNHSAPKGWMPCEGQILSIAQYSALFSLLGSNYGGDGKTTFALPDLRGRAPIHFNASYPIGDAGGEQTHVLTTNELPQHTHRVHGSSNNATSFDPSANTWATPDALQAYGSDTNLIEMNPTAISTVGGGEAHSNMQPSLALNLCIAITGVYPSRN